MQINVTQIAGLAAFAPAALLAGLATRRAGPMWWAVAIVNAAMAIEVVAMRRYLISDALRALLRIEGDYQTRSRPQEAGLAAIALTVLVALLAVLMARRGRGKALTVALLTTLGGIAVFAIETVSLHALDALFYRFVGPIRLIGYGWLASGLGTALAAGLASRARPASTASAVTTPIAPETKNAGS